ncbi:dihydrofolate reductase family protein [Microlunatus flavus]|uniref:Dihydrofolate reductase n=1 Tax=Microlunatus flavus TaxID=1036181 RepID=A0A1H9EWA9_9ACTN|nr:dihydrofolate reductase family protein [Microlunatus flavus]SEQ29523.1 Dihydrofolate reductase [Microlunatus flavus]
MRDVVAYELVSVDGVAEGPDRFFAGWDAVMDANLARVIVTQDAVVLGRRSHDDWAGYWPTSDVEPFATSINEVPKHVATSRPLDATWSGASAIEGDLVAFVRDLKQRSGGDVGVHASLSVVQALLAAGLVDELRLVVAPAVAGSGRRLLDGVPPLALETVRSTTSPTGALLVDYRVLG